MKLIPKEKLIKTKVDEQLYKKLSYIWNDEHFIIGIFAIIKTEEQKQKLLNELDNGLDDTDTIILLAIAIADGEEL